MTLAKVKEQDGSVKEQDGMTLAEVLHPASK